MNCIPPFYVREIYQLFSFFLSKLGPSREVILAADSVTNHGGI